jgi:hypothetical protein
VLGACWGAGAGREGELRSWGYSTWPSRTTASSGCPLLDILISLPPLYTPHPLPSRRFPHLALQASPLTVPYRCRTNPTIRISREAKAIPPKVPQIPKQPPSKPKSMILCLTHTGSKLTCRSGL